MSFELVIIEGAQMGRRFPVSNVPMTFGRSPSAQLSFPLDNFISGNHLTVQSDGRGVMLTDLRSTNGTFLNGQRIAQAIANVGDTIKIGSMTLQVVFTQDASPVPQPYAPSAPVAAQATTVIPTFPQQPPPPLPRMDMPLPPGMTIPAPPPGAAAPSAGYAPYPSFDPNPTLPQFPNAAPPSFPGSAPFPEPPAAPPFTAPAAPSPSFPPFPGSASAPAPPFPEPPAPAPPQAPPLSQVVRRTIGEISGPIFVLLNPLADPAVGELLRDANADLAGYCLADSADPFAPVPAWSPYLLPLTSDGDVLRQIVDKGWGAGWAAFLTSQAPYEELRAHFRKFVMVQMQGGAEPYFRFWEPAVLRNFFGAANPAELTMFCGPVNEWVLEADPSTSLFRAQNTPTGLTKTVQPLL